MLSLMLDGGDLSVRLCVCLSSLIRIKPPAPDDQDGDESSYLLWSKWSRTRCLNAHETNRKENVSCWACPLSFVLTLC